MNNTNSYLAKQVMYVIIDAVGATPSLCVRSRIHTNKAVFG